MQPNRPHFFMPNVPTLSSYTLPGMVKSILCLCTIPEVMFQLADLGLIVPHELRQIAFNFGSFRPDLVTDENLSFIGQNFSMFLTYMFLHTGISHLIVNMTGLVWLGRLTSEQRNPVDIMIMYLMSGVGAALVFTLIGPPHIDMVGASGAIFGLLGVYSVDSKLLWPSDSRKTCLTGKLLRLIIISVALVVSDLISRVAIGTDIAWQAHTGGFLTGAMAALIWPRR